MRHLFTTLILLAFSLSVFAQSKIKIERDIFDNIVGERNLVKSKLEKNIFDDLIYSDSNNNKVIYKKEFLQKVLRISPENKIFQRDLYSTLSLFLKDKRGYQETYEVDIFDKVIISCNQGESVELDLDMVGENDRHYWANKYKIYNEEILAPQNQDIIKDAFGNLSFRQQGIWASVNFNRFGEAEYEDSFRNKIKFNKQAWRNAVKTYQSDEGFFSFLIDTYTNL